MQSQNQHVLHVYISTQFKLNISKNPDVRGTYQIFTRYINLDLSLIFHYTQKELIQHQPIKYKIFAPKSSSLPLPQPNLHILVSDKLS